MKQETLATTSKMASLLAVFFIGAALHAGSAMDYLNYGDSLFNKNDYAGALKYYTYAAKLDEKMWRAYKGIGSCYYEQGDYQNALTYLDYALKLNPGDADLQGLQAKTRAQLGDGAAGAPLSRSTVGGELSAGAAAAISGEEIGSPVAVPHGRKIRYGGKFLIGISRSSIQMNDPGPEMPDQELIDYSVSAGSVIAMGFAAVLRYRVSEKLCLQVEPGYVKKGFAFEENQKVRHDWGWGGYESEYRDYAAWTYSFNYFEMPILCNYAMKGGDVAIFLNGGLFIGFATGGTVTMEEIDETDIIHNGVVVDETRWEDKKSWGIKNWEGAHRIAFGLVLGPSFEIAAGSMDILLEPRIEINPVAVANDLDGMNMTFAFCCGALY